MNLRQQTTYDTFVASNPNATIEAPRTYDHPMLVGAVFFLVSVPGEDAVTEYGITDLGSLFKVSESKEV